MWFDCRVEGRTWQPDYTSLVNLEKKMGLKICLIYWLFISEEDQVEHIMIAYSPSMCMYPLMTRKPQVVWDPI